MVSGCACGAGRSDRIGNGVRKIGHFLSIVTIDSHHTNTSPFLLETKRWENGKHNRHQKLRNICVNEPTIY